MSMLMSILSLACFRNVQVLQPTNLLLTFLRQDILTTKLKSFIELEQRHIEDKLTFKRVFFTGLCQPSGTSWRDAWIRAVI